MSFNKLSLRTKLLFVFLITALLPTVSTGIVATFLTVDLALQDSLVNGQAQMDTLSGQIERYLDTALSDIRYLARTDAMDVLGQSVAAGETLRLQVLRRNLENEFIDFIGARTFDGESVYREIRFLNPNGFEFVRVNTIDGEPRAASGAGLNTRANESYFRNVLTLPAGDILVSPIDIRDEFGRIPTPYDPVLRYSTRIAVDDITVGILVTDVRAEGFLNLVVGQSRPDERLTLVDQTGGILAHPDPALQFGPALGTGITLTTQDPDLAAAIADTPSYVELQGRVVLTRSITPEGAIFAWTLIAEAYDSAIFEAANQASSVIIVAVAVVTVLVAIASVFVARSISRPVTDLTQAAEAIAGGQYNRSVRVTNSDEIGTLQISVNRMAAQIGGSIETLEQRVADRTAELDDALHVAEAASNAKSEFLSNMSHELRTPLNMVIGYTSSMLTMPQMYDYVPLPEIYLKDVQIIHDNGQHLLGLINDILDLSKIEAGKVELQNQPVNLSETLRGVVQTAIGLVKDKPLQIRSSFADDLPAVWGDPVRIRQILLNLMSNAVKFTTSGTVTLSAHIEAGRMNISVTDTGMGIAQESLGTIFDRFAQIQNHVAIQGTGLGLDIVQRLVTLHGGTIEVESKVGTGSTFRFTLPLATAEQITLFTASPRVGTGELHRFERTRPTEPIEEPTPTLIDTRPEPIDWTAFRTVLLVIEDSFLRAALHRVLEEARYVVFETSQPAEIREFATSLSVDAILLDEDLSAKAGFDIVADLRADAATSAVPIVLMAGRTSASADPNSPPRVAKRPLAADVLLAALDRQLTSDLPSP